MAEAHYGANDTRRYVDASAIPYVVLTGPSAFPTPPGKPLTKGYIVFVVDTKTGTYSGAVYGDVGRAVGEGSLALASMIGNDPFDRTRWPKVTGGISEKRIFRLVFPQRVVASPWPVDQIQKRAVDLFGQWGGEPALHNLYPSLPAMSGPRPVVVEPPTLTTRRREEEEGGELQFKGTDVPKAGLDF